MTVKQIKALEKAKKQLETCGGDCMHCEKCHMYFTHTERAIYSAVGCDLLPTDDYSAIADRPSQLHREAISTVDFELST